MNPIAHIHTHWQVAQSNRTSQNLPKSMAVPTLTEKKKHGHTTLCISNSGSSAILKRKIIYQRSVLPDSLGGVKSATAHTRDRCLPLKTEKRNIYL